MFTLCKCKASTSSALTSLVTNAVAPPIDFLVGPLESEENDDCRKSDGRRPRRRQDVVVLERVSEQTQELWRTKSCL